MKPVLVDRSRARSGSSPASDSDGEIAQRVMPLFGKAKGASANRDKAVIAYALVSTLVQSWRTDGLSFGAIADRLNEKSIPTRTGSTWSAMQVKRLVDRGAQQAV